MKKKIDLPIVPINGTTFDESYYTYKKSKWLAKDLVRHAEETGCKPFDMPLAGMNIDFLPWPLENLVDFTTHCHRVNNCSLDYPIILDPDGSIADGCHRVVKAIVEGKRTIKAIRLVSLPEPITIKD